MVRRGMRYVVAGFVAMDLVLGALLVQHAWDRSWFMWSPPDSTVWYVGFSPYPTFYPGLVLTALGTVTMVALAEDRWWSARDRGRWLRAAAWTHVVLGAALTGVTLILFSSYFVCPNPGVCRDVFEPYPPLAIPSVIVLVAGICGVAIDRLDRGGGTPEGFPGSARP